MNNGTNSSYTDLYGSGHTTVLGEVILYISEIIVTPTISLTSGTNPTTETATVAMTPIVYTYTNVDDDDNVLFGWFESDYETTASAPGGLSISKDTEAKTVTVSGTPTTPGTYYYKITIDEVGGNEIQGSIVVEAYVTPAPTISLTSAAGSNNQTRKAGTAISNITYSLTNAVGASVSGLPTGLSGIYDDGVYTISGTIDAAVIPGTFNYTVTATALEGYDGEDVTATGSVVVKSATAIEILYLTTGSTPPAIDSRLYPHLNNNVNYWVTVKQAAGTAPEASFYDSYDILILNEAIGSTNSELVALKDINKPILNLKSFVYLSGSSRWDWGVADNGQASNGTVVVKQPNHPIFDGITLNSGTLELLSDAAAKGIQPFDYTNIGGITVATAPKNASPFNHAVAIHDVPANVRGVDDSKYLLVAICNDSYDKMTNDALALFDNAIEYLINGEQYVAEPIHFRSRTTGNWATSTLWDSSHDNTNWDQDVAAPNSSTASSVAIQPNHTITVAADASASAVNVKPGGRLSVNADRTLTVTGNLTLESDADGSGTLVNNGTLSVSGTSSVQQHLSTARNWYVSSPLSAAAVPESGYTFYRRDEVAAGWPTVNSGTFTPGVGYIAMPNAAGSTLVFSGGQINTGEVQIPLTTSGSSSTGFNLIGNPYPAHLNWNSTFTGANASLIEHTIWYRTNSGSANAGVNANWAFETYNTLGEQGVPITATGVIPPMQAFWVKAKEAGTLTLNNTLQRTHETNNPLKAPSGSPTERLRLEVSNGQFADEMLLYFNPNASNTFDPYDSPKMFNNNASVPEIYTRAGNERLVINGMNSYDFSTIIPLGFNTAQAGSFSIRASQVQNFDIDTQIMLLDKSYGTQFNLTEGEAYQFTSDATSTEDRFVVMFRSATGTTGIEESFSGMYMYSQLGRLTLQMNTAIENARVTVYTTTGQNIHTQLINAHTTELQRNLNAGVYLVKVENAGKTVVLRTIVK